jgi:hypothetical protein
MKRPGKHGSALGRRWSAVKRVTYHRPEESFGRSDDQRLPEVALHLSSNEMEILSSGRWIGDCHIDVALRTGLEWVISELCVKSKRELLNLKRGQMAQTWSMRSILIEECSGPAPSRP